MAVPELMSALLSKHPQEQIKCVQLLSLRAIWYWKGFAAADSEHAQALPLLRFDLISRPTIEAIPVAV
jgi:hypothetical protein